MRDASTHPTAYPAARFRILDGATELAVAESAAPGGLSRPVRVTNVLATALDEIDGAPAMAETVRRVSSAGREWLLQRAVGHFKPEIDWFEARCTNCGALVDLQFSIEAIPRGMPGAGFPMVEIGTTLGLRWFEAPNGGHEETLAGQAWEDPRRAFAALCGLSDTAEADASRFEEDDLVRIDRMLEELSPEIADRLQAVCTNCDDRFEAAIEPLNFGFPVAATILRDVHRIARAYGWSEEQILALPVARRQTYLEIIRAEAGEPRPRARRLM